MATQQSMDTVQKAYIGYYGRPADPAGLTYWADRLDENGGDLSALINEFGTSDEYTARFEGMSSEDLVNNLYQQLFNRDAEQEGLDFYVAKLENNESSLSEIALDIMNGAQNSDATALENKLVVAKDFTAQVEAEDKVYGEGQIDAAVDLVEGIDASTDLASVDVGDVLINFPNPPMPNALFTLKEQTETVTITTSAETTTTVVYWGYNPHSHDESGDNVDNLDGNDPDGNDNNLTNEGPLDGGVPWAQLLTDLSATGSLGFDLAAVMATMTTAAGNDAALDNLQTLTIGGDTGDGSTTSIQVTLTDGSVHDAIVEMNAQSKAFLNDLLFDSEGNSRLYEQEVVTPAGTSDVEVNVPVVLTPTENSGNTEEEGYTGEGDNTINAGRTELLHKAYIDGGEGVNTLNVGMKGVFAQPKEIVNVQHITVENLPNIYTAVDAASGDPSNSYDPDNADLGEISADSLHSNSVLDLGFAADVETLTITEGGFEGLTSGDDAGGEAAADDLGSLTVTGISGDVVTTIEGNFEQNVELNYSAGLEDAIGVRLNLGDVTESNAVIHFVHNSSVAEIESFGAGNILDAANLGTGTLHTLNITGDAQFVIRDDAAALFSGSHPAEVDASANTAGVDLTITAYADEVIFTGTMESDDHFNATGNGKSVLINGGNGDNEFVASTGTLVTINSGDGNNEVNADTASDDVNITLGDGNNTVTADTGSTVTNITVGNGDNTLGATGGETVAVVAGDGDNTVDVDDSDNVTVTLGAGDNSVRAEGDAETVAITTGDGDNSIIAEASVSLAITTGAGDDTVAIGGTGTEFAQTGTALVNIDLGAGDNTLTLGSAGAGDLGGVTALDNSTITGSDIAVVVYDTSNLCAAELTGITSVTLRESADLTLTAAQFAAIGADNFDVAGSKFGQTSTLTLVVENDLDLSTLNLENLDSSISINLTVANNATLTLTAEELHSHVAENGIDVDDANGYIDNQVVVTDAGIGFDPFAQQNGGTGGGTIVSNVDVTIVRSTEDDAFERPSEDAYEDALVINTDTDTNVDAIAGVDSDVIQSLIVEGAADINFTGSITLAEGFDVDFSALGGSANELTLSQFERVAADIVGAGGVGAGGNGTDADDSAAWGEIIGNGTTENPARINIEVTTGSTTGYADITKGGFKSSGVQTYVVTEILDANGDLQSQAAGGTATIYVCDQTQDLETIGLQNNRDATVTFNQVNWNTAILLEGDGYENSADQEKNLGNPDLSEVGAIVANFFEAGANAEVLITNQGQALGMAEDAEDGYDLTATRTLDVEGITVTNADRLTIDVEDGNAVINAITAVDVERLVVNSANDVTVKVAAAGIDTNDLVAIDASGVAGTFTLNLTNGTYDLSGVDLTGVEALVLGDGVNAVVLTLSATQLIELKDVISDTDSATTLNVVDLSDEALNLTDLDVDTIGTVTFADVDGTIEVNAEANFDGATSLTILAVDSDTTVEMTAEQFNSTTNGTVIVDETGNTTDGATLTLTDLANDETLDLDNVAAGASVVLEVADLTATETMKIEEDGQVESITLELSGAVDLVEADLTGVVIDNVAIADGAVVTMTAAQVLAIGFTDADADGVADAWSGTGMLNITEYNGEALDLDLLEAAGIDIGTITVKDASAATTVTWAGTLGGADEIVTPTAEDGNPEYGTESVTVQMTVAQFAGSAGIITGESVVNLTDLANNVDSDDDGQVPDLTEYDFSGIANAGTISFAADTNGDGVVDADDGVITLSETANFGEFTIVLADGELIRFATEGQAAADISVGAGITTGVQWLFTAITGSVDTSGYETGAGTITSLFIDEALLVANPIEEDLWTDLASGTVVEKVNGADIPELVKYDRVNTFQAFTNIGEGVNYNDSEEFSTVAELTMNLEGEVNLGTILLGDTNNGNDTTPNIDGQGYFTSLTINSYLDLSNNEGYDAGNPNVLPGRVIEVNTLGDITLNDGSVDELVDVTINTYGDDTVAATVTTADDQFNDAINVNSAAVGRDGLAIETGTITFAANEAKGAGEVTLTLTGDNDITIENIDISDDEVSALVVDASDMFLDEGVAGPTLTIGGVNVESYLASVDTITYIDGHTSPEAPATLDDFGAGGTNDLLIVAGGDNDLTEANTAEFEAVHVSADATLTMTYAQVANILITDGDADSVADNWTVADGVTVTLNIEDLPNGADLDLNLLEAAGFNIGTLSTAVDTDVELAATMTLGGADELNVQLSAGNHTLELTAEQYQQLNGGNITETDASDTVANTASVTIDGVEALEDATSGEVSLDLSTVLTTGTNTLQLGDGAGTAATILHDNSAGDNDVTFASAADLASFIINLYDATGTAAANELLGDTVRFNTAAQAERTITITNDGGTDAEQDTNVIWLFNDISGTASGTQIDTSGYGEALGRLWINDQLITDFSNDLEDLFIAGTDLDDNGNADDDINLNGSIIVRIVNTADLDALAAASSGVARKMEVEAYTDTSATGFVFNEEDQLVDVSDLTIDLGGATSLGDLTISNVVSTSNTIEDTDAFGTLTINSLLAASSTQNAYLLPEGFVDGTHTYPTAANVIGDIQTGAERNELTNVVLNTGDASGVGIGTDLIVGEIFFADDGDAADTGTVTLTVNGANNVTVESLDTSDAEVTALTIDNNLTSGGTLTVTGGSPAFDGGDIDDNTETLTINTGTAGNAQIQVVELSGSASADGTITFMGTEITVVDGDDANDVGTAIAAAVAAIQANNPSVAGIVNAAGTLTITMETNAGNVDTIVNATSNGVSFTDGESVEVQDVTIGGATAADADISFMGVDIAVLNADTTANVATKIAAAEAAIKAENANVDTVTAVGSVVTVTFLASTENAGAIINATDNGVTFTDGVQAATSQLSTTPMTVFGSTDGATTYAGIASGELSELNIAETGSVDLGVIALVDSADFTLAVANADAYVTATLGEANVNGASVSPELDDGGTWIIDNVDELAIDGSTTFGAATLTITNSNVTVDTDVDWSELTALTMTGSTIVVAAGEELTITPALADGLTITGEGTVILVGDYDNGAAADYDLSNINVANIDASGITDTDLADDATDTVNTTGVTLDISGGAQDTALIGSNFDDTVTMDETDTIAAGTGTDTVTFNTAVTAAELEDADMSGVEGISVTADDATYDFSAQTEDLDITGDADDQFIIGGEGNDDIDGGAGADALSGGDGDDVLIADGNDLAIEGGDGDDTLEISADLNLQASAAVVSFTSVTQTLPVAAVNGDNLDVTVNGTAYALTAAVGGAHIDIDAFYAALAQDIMDGDSNVVVTVTGDAFTFTPVTGAVTIDVTLNNNTNVATAATDGVSFSGVETVTATADGADLTLDYTQVGDLDEFNGFTTTGATVEQLNVVGSDDNDTIDLGAITLTDAIASIAAGDGNDVIVAEDTFVIDGGNNAATAVTVSLDDDSDSVTAGTTDNAPGGNDYDSFSFDDNLAVGDKFRITIGDDHYDYESDTVVESDAYAAIAALINADASALVTATASATQVLLTEKLITGNIVVTVESLGDIVQFADDVTAANLADGDLTNVENIDITNTTDGTYDFSAQATEAAAGVTITGSESNDTIAMGALMDDSVIIDGGAGNSDEIQFTDNGNNDNDLDSVTNVEVITLGDATTDIAFAVNNESIVKEGETLIINGAALTAGQTLTLDTTEEDDGNLIVTGGLDADTIDTGDGDDQVTGGEGIDTIDTGAGDDTLIGGIGDDILTGGAGNDTFEVTADNDTISDLENGDVIVVTGNAGATVAVVGDFFATADTSNDTLTGTVTLNLQNGQADFINMDAATGTVGYTINGSTSSDDITGSDFDDIIDGGADADEIRGGAGDDDLTGGAAADNFVYASATDGVDTYTDFVFNGTDTLELTIGTLHDIGGGGADSNVSTAVNAGAVTPAALAADAAAVAGTDLAVISGDSADMTVVSLTAAQATIEAAIEAQLADGGADFSANITAAGEGTLLLIENDADNNGAADSYFLAIVASTDGNATTDAGEVTLLGIFEDADAANVAAGDLV